MTLGIIAPRLFTGNDKKGRVRYLCRILGTYYADKKYAVCREVGLPLYHGDEIVPGFTNQRADFIAINKKWEVVIVETKSCFADFASDKKWKGYLQHCDRFYFAADEDTAQKIVDRLDADDEQGVGVIAISLNSRPAAILDNIAWICPARKHVRTTPVNLLLWQMAARASGFGFGAVLHKGNVFEDAPAPTETMRIK